MLHPETAIKRWTKPQVCVSQDKIYSIRRKFGSRYLDNSGTYGLSSLNRPSIARTFNSGCPKSKPSMAFG
jgi:hypothetical protein